ncbi:unnamed protein product [Moneuplotes crassus]|uniref:Uncharacterized protein n=1 Tax=Euplotes crassus TaxID=5936 RepID=A0AAD1XYD1_EUPCR|nr:unnamed protein product [Moneuplotes crassus]
MNYQMLKSISVLLMNFKGSFHLYNFLLSQKQLATILLAYLGSKTLKISSCALEEGTINSRIRGKSFIQNLIFNPKPPTDALTLPEKHHPMRTPYPPSLSFLANIPCTQSM